MKAKPKYKTIKPKHKRVLYKDGGSFMENFGAASYGILEGTLNTATFGATSGIMDAGYNALDKDGSTVGARGAGRVGGAAGTAVLTGGATTKGAVVEGTKGAGQSVRGLTEDDNVDMITGFTDQGASVSGMFMGGGQGQAGQLFSAKYGGKLPRVKYNEGGEFNVQPEGGVSPQHTIAEYDGLTHEQGGIPIGNHAEVEDGEFKYKDMIFSNALTYEKEK